MRVTKHEILNSNVVKLNIDKSNTTAEENKSKIQQMYAAGLSNIRKVNETSVRRRSQQCGEVMCAGYIRWLQHMRMTFSRNVF